MWNPGGAIAGSGSRAGGGSGVAGGAGSGGGGADLRHRPKPFFGAGGSTRVGSGSSGRFTDGWAAVVRSSLRRAPGVRPGADGGGRCGVPVRGCRADGGIGFPPDTGATVGASGQGSAGSAPVVPPAALPEEAVGSSADVSGRPCRRSPFRRVA